MSADATTRLRACTPAADRGTQARQPAAPLPAAARTQAVLGSGWPEGPHVAAVVSRLAEGPQALAGMAPPNRCHDPADCPPDFLGCQIGRASCRAARDVFAG